MFLTIPWKFNMCTFMPADNPNTVNLFHSSKRALARILNLFLQLHPTSPINSSSDFTRATLNAFVVHRESPRFKLVWLRELFSYSGCNLFWLQIHSSFEDLVVFFSGIRPFQFLECGPRFPNTQTEQIHGTAVL